MSDKDSFFGQLYALNKSDSDSDIEPNESREFLKKCNNPILDPPSQREQSLLTPLTQGIQYSTASKAI
ncbi:hypothetical protein EYC80_010610 [Monilinia laxa]|uniref:Uncharacterized protein n=1 Tax=Monilinia laxa TaxID=61186 RepID=A0A5N6JPA6_MONLA|nr:hypothetical protein EYC80_010610 [Monilinia laxa]